MIEESVSKLEKELAENAAYIAGRIHTSQSLRSMDTTLENYRVRKLLEERLRLKEALRLAMACVNVFDEERQTDTAKAVLAVLRGEGAATGA